MKLILIIIFVIGNLMPARFADSSKTRAFLTNIKGTVLVQSRGKPEAIITDTEFVVLFDDDMVRIGDDGGAKLWQAYSKILPLEPKTTKRITRLPPSSGSGVLSLREYIQYETRVLSLTRDASRPSPRKQGGTGEQYFIALSPRFSIALSPRPIFEWTPLRNAASYDFVLYDADENKIWEDNIKEPRITYPDHKENKKARELKPGKYIWEVFANIDKNIRRLATAEFTIATPKEADKIQAALSNAKKLTEGSVATNLIYVATCFEHKQYPEAEKVLKAALLSNPDDWMLKLLLMQAYEYMKRPDEREDLRVVFKDLDILEIGRKFRLAELLRKQ